MKSIMKVIYNFQMSKELLDLNKKHWTYRRNIIRATGAQDSRRILSYITVCDYNTTYLQENPQRLG